MNPMFGRLGAVAAAVVVVLLPTASYASTPTTPRAPVPNSQYAVSQINEYRIGSGLPTVSQNQTWSDGLDAHAQYLALNDGTPCAADWRQEVSNCPGYTPTGAAEAPVSTMGHIRGLGLFDLVGRINYWMASPFDAMGMLQPGLQSVGFGTSNDRLYAGLDVTSGLTGARGSSTVFFPGNGMTTDLTTYVVGRNVDLRNTCGWSGQTVGLPVFAMLPSSVPVGLTATLASTAGIGVPPSTSDGRLCLVDEHTFTSQDNVHGPAALQALQDNHAVILVPQAPMSNGRYTATIHQPGGPDITWSFVVSPGGSVAAGNRYRIHVANNGAATVLGTLTATVTPDQGFASMYSCSARPGGATSNVNYVPGASVANFAAMQPDENGDVCFYTSGSPAKFIWDQVAETNLIATHLPVRKLDTRRTAHLVGGQTLPLAVAPAGTKAVLGNLTVTHPAANGYATVYPCDAPRPNASNINFVRGQTIANFATVKPSAAGRICFYSPVSTDLIWDQVAETNALAPHAPVRLVNTRATGHRISIYPGGYTAHLHVSAPGTKAVIANATIVNPSTNGYVTFYTCNNIGDVPNSSNITFRARQTVANQVMVAPDASGDVCIFVNSDTDFIWDQVATSTTLLLHRVVRVADLRHPGATAY